MSLARAGMTTSVESDLKASIIGTNEEQNQVSQGRALTAKMIW
jgi:hypothetical protein